MNSRNGCLLAILFSLVAWASFFYALAKTMELTGRR